MAVFPETMNKIDPAKPEEALRTIDNYIRYMGERVEFSNQNMSRNMNASGQSTAQIVETLNGMSSALSLMQSNISGMLEVLQAQGETISGLAESATALEERMKALEDRVTALEPIE